MAGTLTPPSHVVPLPHRRGPALPPRTSLTRDGLRKDEREGEKGEREGGREGEREGGWEGGREGGSEEERVNKGEKGGKRLLLTIRVSTNRIVCECLCACVCTT